MQFLRSLRDGIRNGHITSTVRLWQRPHVRVGGRYSLALGKIEVTKMFEVSLAGPGRRVFVIEFRYLRPNSKAPGVRRMQV